MVRKKKAYSIYLLLLLIIIACTNEKAKKTNNSDPINYHKPDLSGKETTYDTLNADIYNFMLGLIEIMSLDKSYGLQQDAETTIDPDGNDREFLTNFVMAENLSDTETDDNIVTTDLYAGGCYPRLDNTDVEYMLKQNSDHKNFVWDNNILGFDLYNKTNWYSFSVPVFNKAKNIVIISIYDLCPGLCGNGELLIFTKMDNRWDRCRQKFWLH